ncbi:MAG TPA: hypothetical protein VF950_20355 [Planctomycetota bacterium]
MRYGALAMLGLLCGCDPVSQEILEEILKETDNFVLVNRANYFYRSADHHKFKAVESYAWRNCGATAVVDLEVEPSCPNDVTVNVYDAENTRVFSDTFHAPHCGQGKKDWPPMPTAAGVPGVWRIELAFDLDGVKDLEILITGTGDCDHEVFVDHGNNGVGNGEDPQPPGQPPVNDGPGTGPGVPGNQGGPFVLWRHQRADDRDVVETYYVRMDGTAASIEADWTEWTSGTLRVVVQDDVGAVVYDRVIDAGAVPPLEESTSSGAAGTWSVTFTAVDLSARGLRVTVFTP